MNRRRNKWINLLIILLIAFFAFGTLTSCGKRPEAIQSEFVKLIEAKPTPEGMAEVSEYLNKYLHKLDQEDASDMLIAYEGFLSQYINTESDQIQVQGLLTFYKDGKIDQSIIKKDETAKEYYGLLRESYIAVGLKEEKIVLYIDYKELYDAFKRDILPALAALYSINGEISAKPATENATIQIPYKDVLARVYTLEKLIREYKDEPRIAEDSKWLYSNYLNLILIGTTNSPNFDYQTGVFAKDTKAQYDGFIAEHPDTTIAWALAEYENYLKSVDYKINYKDKEMSKAFFDQCARIVSEAEKRVYQ